MEGECRIPEKTMKQNGCFENCHPDRKQIIKVGVPALTAVIGWLSSRVPSKGQRAACTRTVGSDRNNGVIKLHG